jgi:AcrR family transcriptional regulator
MDRRQHYREQTRQEAKRIALEQLAEDGIAGISVNAIGKRMGITGPALYRYFANRDALLTDLISDGYHDFADALEAAIPAGFRAVATAMRDWAIAAPHRYLLLFGNPVPGYEAPEHTLGAANRAMTALLSAVGEDRAEPAADLLHEQIARWGQRMGHDRLTPRQQHWGLIVWSRLHGVVSLEITGQYATTGIDPELLFRAEVDALVAWWE